jgi:hypothetical protein
MLASNLKVTIHVEEASFFVMEIDTERMAQWILNCPILPNKKTK